MYFVGLDWPADPPVHLPTMSKIARLSLLAGVLLAGPARAADWPTWRYDAQRSGCSPQELADQLHLQWVREYPAEMPAWPEQEKMLFDTCYEPVIAGKMVYLNSSRHDCIRALD